MSPVIAKFLYERTQKSNTSMGPRFWPDPKDLVQVWNFVPIVFTTALLKHLIKEWNPKTKEVAKYTAYKTVWEKRGTPKMQQMRLKMIFENMMLYTDKLRQAQVEKAARDAEEEPDEDMINASMATVFEAHEGIVKEALQGMEGMKEVDAVEGEGVGE
ncbi:hypothetical protein BJ508DRAFT_336816 [Ascobolus immersus RN42]|nr:hypothetical protein BJ508DRAFT_336816 [Ascobolus immersus RN42]